jgi:GntR family transcriptional regulator / MocR family aminotransferase
MDFPINLDSQSKTTLHRQLYDEIRRSILSGRLPRGQKVPSTRALSASLGISRATVTMSYEYLLSEGYLEATTGSGTYVCRQLPEELLRAKDNSVKTKTGAGTAPRKPGPVPNFKKLSRFGTNLRDKPWISSDGFEPEIQFSFSRPDIGEFPMRQWMALYNQRCRQGQLSELDSPSNSAGYMPLRQAIASYLSRARAVSCRPEQVTIVNGSQQAIDLVTRVLVDRGDTVAIENPGYIGALKALEVQGAQIVGIPVDSAGIDATKLKEHGNSLKLVYVTPSHQSPTGVVMSLPRRLELLSWAERTGTYIIEDDYDSEYRYKGRPIPALAGLEHHETVIYIGTFSKVLFPALRLGYLVLPQPLVSVFERAKWIADRHSPLLEQQVLADFINGGHLDRHVRRMRALYEQRRKTVISTLAEEFGENVTVFGDNAGINVLVRLRSNKSDQNILTAAKDLDIGLRSTAGFYLSEPPAGEFLLNYGGLTEEQIREGLRRLKIAVR